MNMIQKKEDIKLQTTPVAPFEYHVGEMTVVGEYLKKTKIKACAEVNRYIHHTIKFIPPIVWCDTAEEAIHEIVEITAVMTIMKLEPMLLQYRRTVWGVNVTDLLTEPHILETLIEWKDKVYYCPHCGTFQSRAKPLNITKEDKES